MRKTLSTVLSVILALTLCACGSDTNAGAAAESAAEEVTEKVEEAAEAVTEEAVEEAAEEVLAEVTPEEIDALLQGTWTLPEGSDGMSFEDGKVVISGSGQMMSGTYEVDPEQSAVIGHFDVEDKTLKITIPYTYEDGVLKIFNNRDVELIKQ